MTNEIPHIKYLRHEADLTLERLSLKGKKDKKKGTEASSGINIYPWVQKCVFTTLNQPQGAMVCRELG